MRVADDGTMVVECEELPTVIARCEWLDFVMDAVPPDARLSLADVEDLCAVAVWLHETYGPRHRPPGPDGEP